MNDHTSNVPARDNSTKLCIECNQYKPLCDFSPHGLSKDGLRRVCEDCRKHEPAVAKTCNGCGQSKPLSEFYQLKSGRRAGKYFPRCKECQSAAHQEHYFANRDRLLEKFREYRKGNREKLSAIDRARRLDPAFREKRRVRHQRWRDQNRTHVEAYYRGPETVARQAVQKAVQRGELPPAYSVVCEHCQEAVAAHYHHLNGYEPEYRLDVVALCTECHGKERWVD